jgi:hypothetical protein
VRGWAGAGRRRYGNRHVRDKIPASGRPLGRDACLHTRPLFSPARAFLLDRKPLPPPVRAP